MVRPILRARAIFLPAMLGALFAPAAQAADMDPVVEPAPAIEGPVEWGSGWYLRGQVGAADFNVSNIDGMVLQRNWPTNWTIGLGGGYQYNSWFRTDVTVDYQELWRRRGLQSVYMPCVAGAALGICAPVVDNHAESINFMANAYVDLGTWWGLTPYVGAGAGANLLLHRTNVAWSPANFPYLFQTYRRGDFFSFAYAGMAGVTYDVDAHWKIDLGYRYINLGRIEGYDIYNYRFARNLMSHQIRLGFRYVID